MGPLSPALRPGMPMPTPRHASAPDAPGLERGLLSAALAPPGAVLARPGPASRPQAEPPPVEEAPPKKSLLRRVVRTAFWTGMTAATGLAGLAGVAWNANRDALTRPPSVTRTLDGLPAARTRPPLPQMTAAPSWKAPPAARGPMQVPRGGVSVLLPSDTLTSFVRDMQDDPAVKQFLDQRVAVSRAALREHLQKLQVPPGQELLDLEAPLPTGERPLLRVGDVDLPSFGLRALERQSVPLTLDYRIDPVQPELDVRIEPVRVDQPVRPPGLEGGAFLGAVRVTITAPEGRIPVKGAAGLRLDLEGRDATAQLQRRDPDSPEAAALRARLDRTRQLQAADPAVQGLLRDAFHDQRVEFEIDVRTGGRPLAEATYHLWVGADTTGDGRSDLQVAVQQDLAGLQALDLRARRIDPLGEDPGSRLGGFLHEQVERQFEKGIKKQLPQVAAEIRRIATQEVGRHFGEGVDRLEGVGNEQLQTLYGQGRALRIPLPGGLTREVNLSLGEVRSVGGPAEGANQTGRASSLVLHFHAGATEPGEVELRLPPGMRVEGGQAAVRVSGVELNQQLRDQSEGGAVDWKGLLRDLSSKHGLPTLEFGRDEAGRTVYPRLVLERGRPAIAFDLLVQPEGLSPVKGGTGLVQGATGALDGGLADVQAGLKKEAGVVGDVAGTVVRAPFFLLNKVVEGVRSGVDNTVGKIVDAVPEVATRPTIHSRVVIPMVLEAREGRLHVEPDVSGVRLGEAETKKPADLLDLLPTRMIGNLIANAVAQSEAPSRIGQGARQAQVDLDLSRFGLELKEVGVVDRDVAPPDLVFKVQSGEAAADFVSRQFLGRLLGK